MWNIGGGEGRKEGGKKEEEGKMSSGLSIQAQWETLDEKMFHHRCVCVCVCPRVYLYIRRGYDDEAIRRHSVPFLSPPFFLSFNIKKKGRKEDEAKVI